MNAALITLLLYQLGVHSQGYYFPRKTLKIISRLNGAVIFPLLVLILSTLVGYALFGDTENFHTFQDSFDSVFLLFFGETISDSLFDVHRVLGNAFTYIVGALLSVLIVNVFTTEFMYVYEKVHHEIKAEI